MEARVMEADNGAAPNAGTWLEWAQTWLDGHGAGDWTVTGYGPLGEARIAHGEGVAAVLQLQGAWVRRWGPTWGRCWPTASG